MQYPEYVEKGRQVAEAVEAQDYESALRLLSELLQSDLPELDKSFMSINMGVVWDKKGNVTEALRWYDRAIQLEKRYHRFFALEEKAAYLLRLGRREETLNIYRELLPQPQLSFSDLERVRANIAQLEEAV